MADCPGRDRSSWTYDDIYEVPCSACGELIEFLQGRRVSRLPGLRSEGPQPTTRCSVCRLVPVGAKMLHRWLLKSGFEPAVSRRQWRTDASQISPVHDPKTLSKIQEGPTMARMRVVVEEAGVELTAELNASATAIALWQILPVENTAQTWGAEVYFSVPVRSGPEDPQATVTPGAVGYWPPGAAVCLFFGQQPVSPVNLIGVLEGDPNVLEVVRAGQLVHGRLTEPLTGVTTDGKTPRSFVSKYLHFHNPVVPIYDSCALAGSVRLVRWDVSDLPFDCPPCGDDVPDGYCGPRPWSSPTTPPSMAPRRLSAEPGAPGSSGSSMRNWDRATA